MNEMNPYQSPGQTSIPQASVYDQTIISQGTILALARTKPWVQFLAVIFYLFAALMIFSGLFYTFGLAAISSSSVRYSTVGVPTALFVGVGIFYILAGAFSIFLGIKLWKYGSNIRLLMHYQQAVYLESALEQQRSFWKSVGIYTIVCLVVFVLIFIIGIVAAARFASLR